MTVDVSVDCALAAGDDFRSGDGRSGGEESGDEPRLCLAVKGVEVVVAALPLEAEGLVGPLVGLLAAGALGRAGVALLAAVAGVPRLVALLDGELVEAEVAAAVVPDRNP